MKCNDMLIENVPNVIAAACVLHNMCEIHGDIFDEVMGSSYIFSARIPFAEEQPPVDLLQSEKL